MFKASIYPLIIKIERLYSGYILKLKENYIIRKALMENNNKDKDELVANSSSNSKNSSIKYIL